MFPVDWSKAKKTVLKTKSNKIGIASFTLAIVLLFIVKITKIDILVFPAVVFITIGFILMLTSWSKY